MLCSNYQSFPIQLILLVCFVRLSVSTSNFMVQWSVIYRFKNQHHPHRIVFFGMAVCCCCYNWSDISARILLTLILFDSFWFQVYENCVCAFILWNWTVLVLLLSSSFCLATYGWDVIKNMLIFLLYVYVNIDFFENMFIFIQKKNVDICWKFKYLHRYVNIQIITINVSGGLFGGGVYSHYLLLL